MNHRQLITLKLLADDLPSIADKHSSALIDEVLKNNIENAIVAGHFQEADDFK